MADDRPFRDRVAEIISGSSRLNDEIERMLAPVMAPDTLDAVLGREAAQLRRLYEHVLPDRSWQLSGAATLEPQVTEFESELARLRREVREKAEAVRNHAADSEKKAAEIRELRDTLATLQERERLGHLLNRVRPSAQSKLLSDEAFRRRSEGPEPCEAFVVSVDIRRSTELMLKSREPRLFAEFTITLATALRAIMLQNYGVFDKFTGDGVLAFFPDFFSGDDAGYFALNAAEQCHAVFAEHYRRHRSAFSSVMLDTGLGIAIDHGSIHIVQIGGEFTVVGQPVVYACRMAGAEAGLTYVNQPAYDQLFSRYATFDFAETEIAVKHEGRTAAYSARSNGKAFTPKSPAWESDTLPAA